jgi:hypothetical protein
VSGLPKGNAFDSCGTGLFPGTLDAQPLAVENFDLRAGEAIYGFGERFYQPE